MDPCEGCAYDTLGIIDGANCIGCSGFPFRPHYTKAGSEAPQHWWEDRSRKHPLEEGA